LLALNRNRPATQFDVPFGDWQPQSGAGGLGGKVGLEGARQRIRIHAAAGVRDSDANLILVATRLDGERALRAHRVQRVFDDVG